MSRDVQGEQHAEAHVSEHGMLRIDAAGSSTTGARMVAPPGRTPAARTGPDDCPATGAAGGAPADSRRPRGGRRRPRPGGPPALRAGHFRKRQRRAGRQGRLQFARCLRRQGRRAQTQHLLRERHGHIHAIGDPHRDSRGRTARRRNRSAAGPERGTRRQQQVALQLLVPGVDDRRARRSQPARQSPLRAAPATLRAQKAQKMRHALLVPAQDRALLRRQLPFETARNPSRERPAGSP